jgi:hypothetical protein
MRTQNRVGWLRDDDDDEGEREVDSLVSAKHDNNFPKSAL